MNFKKIFLIILLFSIIGVVAFVIVNSSPYCFNTIQDVIELKHIRKLKPDLKCFNTIQDVIELKH